MKKFFVLSFVVFSFVTTTSSFAKTKRAPASETPTDCIGAEDSEKAYLSNVEAALVNAKLKAVPRSEITKTKDDAHNPEYSVNTSTGKKVQVSCDDSGDDQCQCWVGGPKDNH